MMTKNRLLSKIKEAKNIAIFTHKNPDPDAYGSVFAMREFCRGLGVGADIFAIKNKTGYLDNLFPLEELKTDFVSAKYDLVVLLDLHQINRLSPEFENEVRKFRNMIVIDHHKVAESNNLPSQDFLILDNYAANCEILTEFAVECGLKICPKTATYLYTGLMGDTDRFLHNNLSKHVFETAMLLYDKNADVQRVYDFLYRYRTRQQLDVQKFLLSTIVFLEGGKAAYAIYTLEDLKALGADQEDVKLFSNDITTVKGIELSFLCMEYSKDFFKFSVRSTGINTVKFATKMGGGGHICATGFEKKISKSELTKQLPFWIKEILNG